MQRSHDKRPSTPEYYFSRGSGSAPGAHSPATDPRTQSPSTAVPYASHTTTTVTTASQKRASGNSFKNFLTGLRRSSGKQSPNPRDSTDTSLSGYGEGSVDDRSMQQRPSTPGGDSTTDSILGRSLKSKVSGAFGRRRKSSLSNVLGQEDVAAGGNGSQYTSSPRSVGTNFTANPENRLDRNGHENESASSSSSISKLRPKSSFTFWNSRRQSSLRTELEDPFSPLQEPRLQPSQQKNSPHQSNPLSSSPSPSSTNKRTRSDSTAADALDPSSPMSPPPSTLRKRKSGSFWRRKTDVNKLLNDQISRNNTGEPQFSTRLTATSGRRMDLDDDDDDDDNRPRASNVAGVVAGRGAEPMTFSRTPSPPPVLPELKLGGGFGLGKGDSGMFMDEGVFGRID